MSNFLNQSLLYRVIETIISLCVLLLFLAVFIDFALYSKKGQVQKEKKSIVETGTMTLFFLVFYLILRSGRGTIPISITSFKYVLMLLGTGMIVAGCTINILGRFNLGKNWANQIKIYEAHTLVQTGMYKYFRHPLYASIIFMFYGSCLVYHNGLLFLCVTLVFLPFMYYRAKQEEHLLQQRFSQYKTYQENTGMFFPKIIKKRGHSS